MKELPYDFDLFFDIKTKDELILFVKTLEQDLETVKGLVKHHKIELSEK